MIVISWLLIDICDCMIFWDNTGSRASLSAELTGQKRTVRRQKPTNQWFVGFFIAINSGLQYFPPNKVHKSIYWELYSQTILFISNISSFLYEQKSKIFFCSSKKYLHLQSQNIVLFAAKE